MDRLLEYLDMVDGTKSCQARYEQQVLGDAWDSSSDEVRNLQLLMWYETMLSDLVAILGRDRLRIYLKQRKQLDEALLGKPTEDDNGTV